jgi:hypothetical protein
LDHLVLAEGEATGHFHQIEDGGGVATLLEDQSGRRYLQVGEPVTVTHEEHGPITIEAGEYDVRIQREYDPKVRERRVID